MDPVCPERLDPDPDPVNIRPGFKPWLSVTAAPVCCCLLPPLGAIAYCQMLLTSAADRRSPPRSLLLDAAAACLETLLELISLTWLKFTHQN